MSLARALAALAPLALLALGLAGVDPAAGQGGVSVEEARQAFQAAGCVECHDGSTAPDFDGVVAVVREWATRYETIDEAVRYEYDFRGGADSYAEMMEAKKEYTDYAGTPEQYDLLYRFFLQVFEEARQEYLATATQTQTTPPPQAGPGETVTVTVTVTETIVRTKTVTTTVTQVLREAETVTSIVTQPCQEQPEAPATLSYAPALAGVLAVAAAGYAVLAARRG